MVTITVTIRPGGARTEIRHMPWLGRGGGYDAIGEAIEATRRDQVQFSNGTFSVARSHTKMLINNLAQRFGHVHVIQYGGTTKCVEACWTASPDTAAQCECSCAGANHGSKHALSRTVAGAGGPGGELSVSRAPAREYDVYRG